MEIRGDDLGRQETRKVTARDFRNLGIRTDMKLGKINFQYHTDLATLWKDQAYTE